MPIRASDVSFQFTLGGSATGTVIPSYGLHAVFGPLSGAGQRDRLTEVRLVAFCNSHPTLTMTDLRFFFSQVQVEGANLDMALDVVGATAYGSRLTNDAKTPPTTWSTPVTSATGLQVPSLQARGAVGLWLRRRGAGTAPAALPERNTISVTATTPA